ncbi:MAG: hypothetical protein CMF52_07580 [Legionellales bacterium]|nr:hypothetical protein [Legionellales bacterium]
MATDYVATYYGASSIGAGIPEAIAMEGSWATATPSGGVVLQASLGSSLRRWEEVYAKNPTINTSDPRHKKFVRECDLGLSFIQSLRPVSFQWRVETQGARHYGFLGNEVIESLKGRPFAGVVDAPGGIGMRYTELIAPLVKAVQEQQVQIEVLKREVRDLRRTVVNSQ